MLRDKHYLPSWLLIGFIVISFVGFVDATYLTVKHFQGEPPTCTVLKGCEEVTTSGYSVVFGVPVALLGALYYLVIFFVSLWYADSGNVIFIRVVPWLTVFGLLASLWFVYIQLFVLKAICVYCMGSAITSTLLFILGMSVVYFKYNQATTSNS